MAKLSVIIPSRVDQYLNQTVNDLITKAEGEIEVIVVLDGYWPKDIVEDKRVIYLHHGTLFSSLGMRESINAGVSISTGTHIMKIDEHCMVDQGFDVKLIADCADDWVVIPRRYRLDAQNWRLINPFSKDEADKRPPIDYMYIAYPYERPFDIRCGLHGAEWKQRYFDRKDILIDETMSWQGSAWFTTRALWDRLLYPLDSNNYGWFTHESQEIGNKVWLSGGKLMVNKKTWYAHFHKGNKGKGYSFCNAQWQFHKVNNEKGRKFCIDYWLTTKDYKYTFEWLVDKFSPVPTWPENWRERLSIDEKTDYRYSPDYAYEK